MNGDVEKGASFVILSQAEYDALPADKIADGKVYIINIITSTIIHNGNIVYTGNELFGLVDSEGFTLLDGEKYYLKAVS